MKFITNKPIPKQYESSLNQILKNDEALFIVVGDLNLKGRYAESMMAFTTDKIIAFDECYDNGSFSVDYADIEEAQVKRLYGNAVFPGLFLRLYHSPVQLQQVSVFRCRKLYQVLPFQRLSFYPTVAG